MVVIKLLKAGLPRVLNGEIGITFIVDQLSGTVGYNVAHIRDYRYSNERKKNYSIWSIPADGYEFVNKD